MKIVYTREDGGLTVVTAAPKVHIMRDLGLEEMTDTQYQDFVWEKSVPSDAIDPRWIEDNLIPGDRTKRNGWYFDKNSNRILISDQLLEKINTDRLGAKL